MTEVTGLQRASVFGWLREGGQPSEGFIHTTKLLCKPISGVKQVDDTIRLFLLSFGRLWSFLFELGEESVDPVDFKGDGFGIAGEHCDTTIAATCFMRDLGRSEIA